MEFVNIDGHQIRASAVVCVTKISKHYRGEYFTFAIKLCGTSQIEFLAHKDSEAEFIEKRDNILRLIGAIV